MTFAPLPQTRRARRARRAPAVAAVAALLTTVPSGAALLTAVPAAAAPPPAAATAGVPAAGGSAARGPAAKVTARPTARPTPAPPGLGASEPCSSTVAYTLGGKTRITRPLPAVTSQVGGERLGGRGLQVTPSATTPPPAPKATAWLVADLGTGRVLASCNAHAPLAPASSLKVLTALTLTHKLDPAARYTARAEDATVDGTRVGLVPGSVYTVSDLWHALLMGSANDAATALAALGGGTAAATAAMNDTARSLGAADTRALNTSGLDLPGQVSSAYDLALFGRAALADPAITRYFQTRSYAFPEAGTVLGGTRKTFQIQNHDKLLYNYAGALGVKNGWTSTTGGSFVGAAERGGRRLVATVIAADPQTWQMSAALLTWGFTATGPDAQGVGELVDGPAAAAAQGSTTTPGSAPAGGGSGSGNQASARHAAAAIAAKPAEGVTAVEFIAIALVGAGVIGAAGYGSSQTIRRRRAGLGPAADDPWHRRHSR